MRGPGRSIQDESQEDVTASRVAESTKPRESGRGRRSLTIAAIGFGAATERVRWSLIPIHDDDAVEAALEQVEDVGP